MDNNHTSFRVVQKYKIQLIKSSLQYQVGKYKYICNFKLYNFYYYIDNVLLYTKKNNGKYLNQVLLNEYSEQLNYFIIYYLIHTYKLFKIKCLPIDL